MKTQSIVAAILLVFPLWLNAQLIPSEEQKREWNQTTNDLIISNSDRYVDYKRGGKIVFRMVKRTVTVIAKPNQQIAKRDEHIIEFVADGKVFAIVTLDKAAEQNLNVTSSAGSDFSTGFVSSGKRYFHVCVPKYDYYEYIETSGTDIEVPKEVVKTYDAVKSSFFKITEKGYIYELGKENLSDTEKSR